jgi:hypothetical protein
VNDPKIHIYLDDFSSFLELMMQKPQIEFSQLITSFYLNEKIDSTLMKILNSNWDSQLQYVVPCSTLLTIQILQKNKIKFVFNIYKKK